MPRPSKPSSFDEPTFLKDQKEKKKKIHLVLFFKAGYHYVALTVLELAVWNRLALNFKNVKATLPGPCFIFNSGSTREYGHVNAVPWSGDGVTGGRRCLT